MRLSNRFLRECKKRVRIILYGKRYWISLQGEEDLIMQCRESLKLDKLNQDHLFKLITLHLKIGKWKKYKRKILKDLVLHKTRNKINQINECKYLKQNSVSNLHFSSRS